ncbi:hypothetical protein RHMOL_Rhmol02G0215600 [Rhododendron molle]|uniref:Uncharacterized protein n=1 Tax=Rhododendron molle TaxID=49168 RepID=A0ACC0PVD3_RHOML|nr:hypothetical protein RHMOL_Rhmol02G0215600 [Rhododendron molle]
MEGIASLSMGSGKNCGGESKLATGTNSTCIWGKVLHVFSISRRPTDWGQEIGWAIQHLKKQCFLSALYKLAMAGTVYYIWKARNDIVFCNKQYTLDVIYVLLLRMCGIEHLLSGIMVVALLIDICVEFGIFQNIFCN